MKLLRPDPMSLIRDLARRVGALERRQRPATPAAPAAASDPHDGAGTNSTVVPITSGSPTAAGARATAAGYQASASGDDTTAYGKGATAVGQGATAVGQGAVATDQSDLAVGRDATASGGNSIAVGDNAYAPGPESIALGHNANAEHTHATAVGYGTSTVGDYQVNTGAYRLVAACPLTAIPDADLGTAQFSFYLTGSDLIVKVKMGDGSTIMTGTIPLT